MLNILKLVHLIIDYVFDGIAFNDESLNIAWILKAEELKLSAKDTTQPKLNETNDLFEFRVDYNKGEN